MVEEKVEGVTAGLEPLNMGLYLLGWQNEAVEYTLSLEPSAPALTDTNVDF